MGTNFDGLWAVIYNEGKSYLGKVVATRAPHAHRVFGEPVPKVDELCKRDVLDAEQVTLNPVYDFFAPLRPVQQQGSAGYTRDPIVTPFDFAMDDMPVHVRVGAVAFFSEMSDGDRHTYESFVSSADKMKVAARAQRSGIEIVGANGKNIRDLNPRR
jgi:hypothetical protein